MHKKYIVVSLFLLCFLFLEAQVTRYLEHRVRWMENIYTISKKYNIDPNAVLEYNRIAPNEIRRGIILRIPVGPVEGGEANLADTLDLAESLQPVPDYLLECLEYRPSPATEHRVSLILPFELSKPQPNSEFLEFCEGFLLAVADLKEEGMGLRLSLYDSNNYPHLSTFVQSGALLDEELVIGPVYAGDLFEVVNYTYGQNIKVVSPLDPQTEPAAHANPNFFQVNTSPYWQQVNLIQCLQKNSGMVWLFYEEDGADQELVNMTKEILRNNQIVYQEFIHKVEKNRDITGELALRLVQNQNNQVIVVSSDEPFVADILRSLSLVQSRRHCPITLYGNAKWRSFDSVNYEYYHSMNLHLSVSNYIDYQRSDVKHFLARYRALYHAEPSPFAYQGYDVGIFFLRALHTRGVHFDYCLEQGVIPAQPLQSNFHFQRMGPDGGFINTDSRIIKFLPDYRIDILH